jgi:N4-gp56 family major capsid protein
MALTISATDTELPKPINSVFQQTLLRNAQVRAPYFVGTEPGELVTQAGSNVAAWRRIENLTPATTALTELTTTAAYGQGRDAAALSVSAVTATMAKYGNYVILNEETDLFNFPGQFDKILQVIAINAGQSLNRLQRDIVEDNATLIYANGTSDGLVNTIIADTDIKNAINQLDRQSAMTFNPMTTGSTNIGTTPTLPSFWGLCHSDVAIDIAGITGFKSVETYAGQIQTVMGEFGSYGLAGQTVRFISSEDAGVDAGSGALSGTSVRETSSQADLYTVPIFGQDALGSVGLGQRYSDGVYRAGDELAAVDVIIKPRGSGGAADPYDELGTVAWKAWHTGAVLNSAWVRAIRCAASSL